MSAARTVTTTCANFDRLAKLLPTSPSRRWLNGDQQHSMTGPTSRTHAVEGNGWVRHVCHGCPEPEADDGQPDLFAPDPEGAS